MDIAERIQRTKRANGAKQDPPQNETPLMSVLAKMTPPAKIEGQHWSIRLEKMRAWAKARNELSREEIELVRQRYAVTLDRIAQYRDGFKVHMDFDMSEQLALMNLLGVRHLDKVCHLFDDYPCPCEAPEYLDVWYEHMAGVLVEGRALAS